MLAFSVWMGLTYMAVLPPTAGLIGKLCGAARLPTLLGVTFVVHQIGAFLGSWLGGVVLEATGSYDRMWILDLTLAALATASLALGPALRVAGHAVAPGPYAALYRLVPGFDVQHGRGAILISQRFGE